MKFYLLILFLAYQVNCLGQGNWQSNQYDYTIEIPQGFNLSTAIGKNVDFKAIYNESSVVVVAKQLPQAYSEMSIWEMLGDLETFGAEWETGAQEYMINPTFLKFGKTEIDGSDTFWYDYKTDNPDMYSKNYQLLRNNIIYTITLTCPTKKYNYFSPVWYRVKESFQFPK